MSSGLSPVPNAVHRALTLGTRMSHRYHLAAEAADRTRGTHRICWRWDSLAHLQDPMNTAFRAWYRGEKTTALHLLWSEVPTLAAHRQIHLDHGLQVRTLWMPTTPPTAYQQFREHELGAHVQAGFNARRVTAQAAYAVGADRFPPLVVYSEEVVYLLHHTADGHPDGATRTADPGIATALADALTDLARTAEPMPALDQIVRTPRP